MSAYIKRWIGPREREGDRVADIIWKLERKGKDLAAVDTVLRWACYSRWTAAPWEGLLRGVLKLRRRRDVLMARVDDAAEALISLCERATKSTLDPASAAICNSEPLALALQAARDALRAEQRDPWNEISCALPRGTKGAWGRGRYREGLKKSGVSYGDADFLLSHLKPPPGPRRPRR